jgi:DNA polymerase-3 subunit epsilon
MTALPLSAPAQLNLDFDGTALSDTTFCVVDLETTGGSPSEGRITEIGAVKVRAGQVLGEFQTFVNPEQPIPAFITVLTGITQNMVSAAPDEDTAVPMLLEFMSGSVFVAHNAPYDSGFLQGACDRLDLSWPKPQIIDTARLARSIMSRDEVPNHKLATLAQFFRASVTPTHRALDDARATVDVLHGLLERLGSLGILTLEELSASMRKVPTQRRSKRHLADGLPETAGVYTFRDGQGKPLYVGVSGNIRRRVRSYFTSAEQRPRMTEMVGIAETVTAIECATDLEARVRELRLIAQWKPPYNRRARHPEKNVWLKLTVEPFPRLSLVRAVADDEKDGAVYLGPFTSRSDAQAASAAITEVTGLRACTQRLRPGRVSPGCVLAEIGKCMAACNGQVDPEDYVSVTEQTREILMGRSSALERNLRRRMSDLASAHRFEQAAQWRDRLDAASRGVASGVQLRAFCALPQVIAATSRPGGWDLHVIRHGRLAAASFCPVEADPHRVLKAAVQTAEHVTAPFAPASAALTAETRMLLRWLETARLIDIDGQWSLPVRA